MGAALTVDDLEITSVLSGTHLPTAEGWKYELAEQREKIADLLVIPLQGIEPGVTVNNYSPKKITPGVIITREKSTPGVISSWEKFTPTWKKELP